MRGFRLGRESSRGGGDGHTAMSLHLLPTGAREHGDMVVLGPHVLQLLTVLTTLN